MSTRELDRLEVMQRVQEKRLTRVKAGEARSKTGQQFFSARQRMVPAQAQPDRSDERGPARQIRLPSMGRSLTLEVGDSG